jgi:N-acetylglutamate synthase-like GNAT family acetyltransferase
MTVSITVHASSYTSSTEARMQAAVARATGAPYHRAPMSLMARKDGVSVGQAHLSLGPYRAELLQLTVPDGHRGTGTGSALLARAEEEVRTRGLDTVFALLSQSDDRSFLRARGYREVDYGSPGDRHPTKSAFAKDLRQGAGAANARQPLPPITYPKVTSFSPNFSSNFVWGFVCFGGGAACLALLAACFVLIFLDDIHPAHDFIPLILLAGVFGYSSFKGGQNLFGAGILIHFLDDGIIVDDPSGSRIIPAGRITGIKTFRVPTSPVSKTFIAYSEAGSVFGTGEVVLVDGVSADGQRLLPFAKEYVRRVLADRYRDDPDPAPNSNPESAFEMGAATIGSQTP